jgi:hypothetical protein
MTIATSKEALTNDDSVTPVSAEELVARLHAITWEGKGLRYDGTGHPGNTRAPWR